MLRNARASLAVTGGAGAAHGSDVVEVFGDGVVGRPPGAGDGRMVGRGVHSLTMPLARSRRWRTVAAVPARVDLEQGVGEVAHLVGVHRLGVERGGFGFERLDVAPAELERVAGFGDGGSGAAGVADGKAGLGRRDCGAIGCWRTRCGPV